MDRASEHYAEWLAQLQEEIERCELEHPEWTSLAEVWRAHLRAAGRQVPKRRPKPRTPREG